ncbi:MAG TPA: hypothetical protein VGG57_11785 [Stellaceae bacterium]|jgi:hypothetical protein
MSKLAWWLIAVGYVAASVAGAPQARAFTYECNGDQAKCPSVRCSGDASACQVLKARQDGVDHETGAHIVIGFHVAADQEPKTMELVLTVGEKLSDCSGSARDVYANANNDDARSIDGLLCSLRATWTRH